MVSESYRVAEIENYTSQLTFYYSVPLKLPNYTHPANDYINYTYSVGLEDNTFIELDLDNNGTVDTAFVINRGEDFYLGEHSVSGPLGPLFSEGVRILSSKPLRTDYIHWNNDYSSYDDCQTSYPLLPSFLWGEEFYVPMGGLGMNIGATESGAIVKLDSNNDGIFDDSTVLGGGEIWHISNVTAGTHVIADRPIFPIVYNYDYDNKENKWSYELHSLDLLGTEYYTCEISSNYGRLYLVGTSNGTTVQLDLNADGTFDTTCYLNAGDTINFPPPIVPGIHIVGDKNICCLYKRDNYGAGHHQTYAYPLVATDGGLVTKIGMKKFYEKKSGRDLFLVSFSDGDTIAIDYYADGTIDSSFTLDKGQTYLITPDGDFYPFQIECTKATQVVYRNRGAGGEIEVTDGHVLYQDIISQPPLVIAGPDTNPEDGIHDDSPFDFNETISFVGQAIPAGGAVIDSTRWDFDDGVSIKDQLNVQHQYTDLDSAHTAILTAWDNWGLWASDTLNLWILTAEPPQVNSISALYDGISDEDTIGTFISGFTANNTFYASVTPGGLDLDSVVFELGGVRDTATYESESGLWKVDFADIGFLPVGDNLLKVTAYDVEGNPGEKTAIVRMREIPSWYNGEWISLIEHHEEYQLVTTDGTPYYYMEISIPEPPVEWGPYDFSIEPFFPDLSNHFKVFLGIKGRFNIDGGWSDHEVGGELIAKLLGRGIDENVSVEEGDMRFEGPYNDLVGVTISGLGYEIPNQTLFGTSGWLATFWVGAVQIDLFYSAAFGLQAYIDLGAEFSIDTNYDSYVYLNPGIQPWVSLDVWASILFGVAEVGMNFTPTFGIEFPCTLFVYPDPHAVTHHCTYFVLYYSVWGSVGWGLWKGTLWGPEAGFHFDEPEGCHWGEYEFEVTPPIAAMIDSVLQYLPQVFETPSAAVDPNSNRAFVVWIRDEHPEDTLLTDPEVYYGYLDSTEGAEWVYGSITDNDRWETNPKVAFLSSDSVIAVWTQNEIPKADWGSVTELNTVLSNQELYYSIWTTSSGSWTVPIRITTNSLPDGCADLQARNGKAIMAWVRDLDGDLNTRTDWEVLYSWYDTSGWSTPAVLSEGMGSNFEPAIALDDSTGQAIVVWTHEPDGNFNTPDDRGLYYKYIDPATGPDPLGTDLPHEMGPLSPSVAFAPGRNPVVAYTSRSVEWDSVSAEWDTLGVGLRDELFFSYYKADAWHSMQVTVDGDSVIAMNPVVKVDNQSRAMIVYRGFEGEGVAGFDGEIFSVYIDLSSGAPKGENHVQYTSDTATTWMPAFDINKEGEGKLVYVTYSPEPPDTGFDNMHIESPAWFSPYLRGDVNGDQTIDLGDVLHLISYLYKNGPAPDPLWVGDVNCDGLVDLGDVLYLINYLYKGGPPPCSE